MSKSNFIHSFFNGCKRSLADAVRANKIKLIVTFMFVLVAISTGIFVAIKCHYNFSLGRLQEINLDNFYSGVAASSSAFFQRCISLVVNFALLTGLAFSPVLYPLACALFIYRGYLFGLNFTLIFIFYGFGSFFSAILIILPCQLITLFAMIMYFIVLQKINCNLARFGRCECNRLMFIIFGFVLFILLNLAETILLCALSGKVILVI